MGAWRSPRRFSTKTIKPEHDHAFFAALAFDGSHVDIRVSTAVPVEFCSHEAGPRKGAPRWDTLRTVSIHAGPADAVQTALRAMGEKS